MNLSEPFIRRPVMTAVLTVSVHPLRRAGLPAAAGERPAGGRLSGHPGERGLSRARARRRWPTTSPRRWSGSSCRSPAWSWSPARAARASRSFTLQFALEKSIDAAATDVQTAINQATGSLPLDLPSPPTFSKTNPNDQPIMYIGPGEQLGDAGQALRLWQHAGRPADQHPAGRQPGGRLRHQVGRAHQGRPLGDGRPRDHHGRPGRRPSATAPATPGAGQFDGASGTFLLRPHGQLERGRGLQQPDRRHARTARPSTSATWPRRVDSVQDERIAMRFWARGYDVPSATVVRGRLPPGRVQRGGSGPDASATCCRLIQRRTARRRAAHASSTTARKPSSTASTTCGRRCSSPSCWW